VEQLGREARDLGEATMAMPGAHDPCKLPRTVRASLQCIISRPPTCAPPACRVQAALGLLMRNYERLRHRGQLPVQKMQKIFASFQWGYLQLKCLSTIINEKYVFTCIVCRARAEHGGRAGAAEGR
jgi:hypothetical protein